MGEGLSVGWSVDGVERVKGAAAQHSTAARWQYGRPSLGGEEEEEEERHWMGGGRGVVRDSGREDTNTTTDPQTLFYSVALVCPHKIRKHGASTITHPDGWDGAVTWRQACVTWCFHPGSGARCLDLAGCGVKGKG